MIYIFDKFNKISEQVYNSLYNLLPPTRKRKADKLKGLDKQICILEYFVLKSILKFENYPDFEYNSFGKPKLLNYNFSISHCNNILCVSHANNMVGVDVQEITNYDEKLANYILNESEQKVLQKAKNKSFCLTKFFVQKEATIKCLGLSLSVNFKTILQNKNQFKYNFKKYKNHVICECEKII